MADRAYRCLVTASRSWTARSVLYAALDEAEQRAYAKGYRLIVVAEGDAQGGDKMAGDWAGLPSSLPGMVREAERHPVTRADWYPGGRFDPSAGFRRNAEMVLAGAHEALAFADPCAKPQCRRPDPHPTHGTDHCATMAAQAGIQTRRYTSDG